MKFILSDSTHANSYGFRTDLGGMNLERFRSNPVMLFSHDDNRVIGRWENVAIEEGRLVADAVFDTDDADAAQIAGKVERGFLKGCSIGMIVDELREIDGVVVATKTELLEASICAVPADANAIALYDQNRRRLSADDINKILLSFNHNLNSMSEQKPTAEQLQQKVDELTTANETLTIQLEAGKTDLANANTRIAELEAQVAEAKKAEVAAYLSAAVKDGKIEQAEVEHFSRLAESGFDEVKAILDARSVKPQTRLAEVAAQRGTDEDAAREYDRRDREGSLLSLKRENPARFAELFKARFGVDYQG